MKKGILIVIAYGAALLAGCAATTGTAPDTGGVEARASERMELVIAGELLKAYEYLSPGYRSSVSAESYLADMITRKVRWTGSELLGSECDANRCVVKFKIDFVVPSPVPGVRQFDFFNNYDEDWIYT